MTPADILSAWDRRILQSYSRRTVTALRLALPVRIALPALEDFLAENVRKEVRKDALVITTVAQALAAGRPPDEDMLRELLAAQREIDRQFLTRVGGLPAQIVVRYEEIEPVRKRRMVLMAEAVRLILSAWRDGCRARAVLVEAYAPADLERLVRETMRLYAMETQLLSRSLRLPALLVPLREKLSQNLQRIMSEVAQQMARDVTDVVYRSSKRC